MKWLDNYWMQVLIGLAMVFAPLKAAILTMLTLVGVDFITGILSALKRKKAITSAKMRNTAVKLVVYFVAMALGFLTEVHLTGDLMPISKLIASFVGLTEMKSILENLNILAGGNLLKSLMRTLQKEEEDEKSI